MSQPNLIFTRDSSFEHLKRIESVFSVLPNIDLPYTTGRPSHPVSAMLNALIFKNIRGISLLTELVREIEWFPAVAQVCGLKSSPSKERFSSFIKDTPNEFFQAIREDLVKKLIALGEISTKFISTDSCPVKSPVRENNLKTNVKNRFDKNIFPKADPEARLGIYVTYPTGKKKVQFFWGYRNHIINDASSELPLAEITKPANTPEQHLAIPQLKYVKDTFKLPIEAVIADSGFDSSHIIEFIVKELKAKPIIAKNPRGGKNPDIKLSRTGIPICIAGFEMISKGKFYDKSQNRWRHKFICPIKGSVKFARKFGFCPWNHPKFHNNRFGCTTNLRTDVDQSIRNSIDYGSQTFKKLYNLRTSTERIFARFLTLCMQKPSIKGLNATANICTIAHITVLALALAAAKSNHKDKIRFIKRFMPTL